MSSNRVGSICLNQHSIECYQLQEEDILSTRVRHIVTGTSVSSSSSSAVSGRSDTTSTTQRNLITGEVRVDGNPVHFSESDWQMKSGAPCLGEDNEKVFIELLGLSKEDLVTLKREQVI